MNTKKQNRIISIITRFVIILLLIPSCEKVLDVSNTGEIDESAAWGDPNAIDLMVTNIYYYCEPEHWKNGYYPTDKNAYVFRYTQGIISDEGRPRIEYLGRRSNVNNGTAFRLEGCPFQTWSYSAVRRCNDFLEKIDKLYVLPDNAPQSEIDNRNRMIGEVTFFRAYKYWRMVMIYGGIPIVDKVLNPDSPELYGPRNTMEECFNFILKDLQRAADLLPSTYPSGNLGRITKGAALAMLSRVQLFRASPLYNESHNTTYWQDASKSARAVLDLNIYSIEGVEFGSWFTVKNNTENIYQIEFVLGKFEHGWDAANHPNVPWAKGDAVATCPSQELVDAFPMLNGKAITDAVSGYDPNDPYNNRDPRLKKTVITNGDLLGGKAIWTYVSEGKNEASNYKYNGNGFEMTYATSTGYYMRKAIDERILVTGNYNYGRGSYSDWVEIRLAEVMLNYAEAENELGNTAVAYDMIGQLRKRAGIAAGDGNYGLAPGLTTDRMREVIQNERFIELAFENKRYWDLRRWRLSEIVLNQPTHSMKITKKNNTPPTTNGTDYTYERLVNTNDQVYPPVFQEKFYFLPLPKDQLILNPNLEQNELWK